MWCQHCQQDMPGIAVEGEQRCIRCSQSFGAAGNAPRHTVGVAQAADFGLDLAGAAPLAALESEDWELADDVRRAQRILATAQTAPIESTERLLELRRQALPDALESAWRQPSQPEVRIVQQARTRQQSGGALSLSWLMLALGVMGFVCGAVLLIWSYFSGDNQLWNLGLPIALVGQAGLLIGFVLQLDRLREDSSQAVEKLNTVDERIYDLRQATTMLSTTHGSGAQAFYAHMAEGASPHILLADLKGQLDLLALRMAKG